MREIITARGISPQIPCSGIQELNNDRFRLSSTFNILIASLVQPQPHIIDASLELLPLEPLIG